MSKTSVRTLRVLLVFCLMIVSAHTVLANDIKVDDRCTLSEAIGSANNDSSKARCETGYRDDTIFLKENIVLDEELPYITSKITLEGNGYAIFVRQNNPAFTIKYGELTIRNLRVRFRGENRAGPSIEIKNGSITIIDSKIHNCSGKFQIEDSQGVVTGDDYICGYKPETVNSWFYAAPALPETEPMPSYPFTCESLSGNVASVTATYGLQSGVQCRHVDARGIGNKSVIEAGFIDAVDIWGYVEQGVHICFPQPGSIILLDAATAPRSVVPLEAYSIGETTCVALDRPGTVVLVPGQSPPREEPVTAPVETIAETDETVVATEVTAAVTEVTVAVEEPPSDQCQITTTGHLRHRAAPRDGRQHHRICSARADADTLVPNEVLESSRISGPTRLDHRQSTIYA